MRFSQITHDINTRPAPLMAEVGSTRFDVIKRRTDLRDCIVLCERSDNPGRRVTTVIRQCLHHLLRHGVWHQADFSRHLFVYFEPATISIARLTPVMSVSGEILDILWYSLPDRYLAALGLDRYEPADDNKRVGIFSQESL